jgi:hypothetical protein
LKPCGEMTTGQVKSPSAYLSSIDAVVNSEVDGAHGLSGEQPKDVTVSGEAHV